MTNLILTTLKVIKGVFTFLISLKFLLPEISLFHAQLDLSSLSGPEQWGLCLTHNPDPLN